MSLEDFLIQSADVTAEAPAGSVPAQDALGGADRSAAWLTVASGIPCLARPMGTSLMAFGAARDDARRGVNTTRIYFAADPVPTGIGSRNRIVVDGATYAVQGSTNPNSMDRIFQVDCERITNA